MRQKLVTHSGPERPIDPKQQFPRPDMAPPVSECGDEMTDNELG